MQMVSTPLATLLIVPSPRRRKHVLPAPVAHGVRIFFRQCIRQHSAAVTVRQIVRVLLSHMFTGGFRGPAPGFSATWCGGP